MPILFFFLRGGGVASNPQTSPTMRLLNGGWAIPSTAVDEDRVEWMICALHVWLINRKCCTPKPGHILLHGCMQRRSRPLNVERLNVLKERSVVEWQRVWPLEKTRKMAILSIKHNGQQTRHDFVMAAGFHLLPVEIRSLVGIVRSRRRLGGADQRPHLFRWRTKEKILDGSKKLKCAFCWAAVDFSMGFSNTMAYCALRSSVLRPATSRITIANWLCQDVLFEPLHSPREVLSAPFETLTV